MSYRNHALPAAVALAVLIAACTSGATPTTASAPPVTAAATTTATPTTTTTTTATTTTRPPSTTTSSTTTTAVTTTIAPRATVIIEGELPAPLEAIVTDLYRWIADDRHPPPDLPADLLALIEASDPTTSLWRMVQASIALLPTKEAVAVIQIDGDFLFAADEGQGWEIVGASIGDSPLWLGAEPKFLLVLGSDARPGQNQTRFRADSIHVLALSPSGDGGTIVGFPRDTYITRGIINQANKSVGLNNVPGSIKWTNLMASRGPEIMLETARELTGLPISGYVVTGFVGFEGLIRAIGGVNVDLPKSIATGKPSKPGFPSGEQHLSAQRTLLLVRIRKTISGGDFARSLNQGMVILAAMTDVQNRGVHALPDLLRDLHKNAWTDLPAGELLALGAAGLLLDPGTVDNLVLPGRVRNISGSSVVLLNEDEFETIIADIAVDGVLDPTDDD